MFNRLLVVCVGNICRSPVAECLLRQRFPNKIVRSAGLAAVVGSDMDATARAVAEERGVICPPHSAVQLSPSLCREADLILVMENMHREEISKMSPESRGKVFLLGGGNGSEIADPYQRDRKFFEQTHDRLVLAVDGWAKRLG